MTSLDTRRLQSSWATIARFGDQVPLFFYSTLFLTHPGARDMFPLAMDVQRDKLVHALGHVVSNVDDLPSVVPVLQQLGRDHRRFAVTRDHYPAVGDALLATLEHFLAEEWDDDLAASWGKAYGVVAEVMIAAAADADADSPPWYDATVASVERRTASVAVLRVTPAVPIPYVAGQSLALEIPARPRTWRYYSPATLPDEDGSFELHVRAVPGGAVSTALVQSTRVGDRVRFGAPVGDDLTLARAVRSDIVLVAGGTGLSPLKALLQQIEAEGGGGRRVILFWGARRAFELYDMPAMERLGRHDWFRLVPCVSDETSTGGFIQHGTAVQVALRHTDPGFHDVFLCGSPEMVDGTLAALRAVGTPDELLHAERWGTDERAGR
jgi:NAD(P)H-flavin reductase/hemoglobin-like flavoprotein